VESYEEEHCAGERKNYNNKFEPQWTSFLPNHCRRRFRRQNLGKIYLFFPSSILLTCLFLIGARVLQLLLLSSFNSILDR